MSEPQEAKAEAYEFGWKDPRKMTEEELMLERMFSEQRSIAVRLGMETHQSQCELKIRNKMGCEKCKKELEGWIMGAEDDRELPLRRGYSPLEAFEDDTARAVDSGMEAHQKWCDLKTRNKIFREELENAVTKALENSANKKELPKAGEVWWLKVPDLSALYRGEVIEATEKTAKIKYLIETEEYGQLLHEIVCRFRRSDLDFVEQVKEGDG